MKCPACQHRLREFKASTITLDGCDGGCGGIWFDYGELAKVNSLHRNPEEKIVDLKLDPKVKVDDYAERQCPRCRNVKLDKKLYSLGSGVILDRCPECKGVWLDHGELEKIHETLHPKVHQPRPVKRIPIPEHIAINFDVVQQVEALQHRPRA